MPPSKKPVPRTPRSPKEDGEVGETLNDVLARHPILSPGMRQCIDSIYEHAEVITPEVAAAVGRLVSAALSPLACKADPADAAGALASISKRILPERSAKLNRARQRHAQQLAQLALAAAKEVQRESEQRAERRKTQRQAIAARPTRSTRMIEKMGRVLWFP